MRLIIKLFKLKLWSSIQYEFSTYIIQEVGVDHDIIVSVEEDRVGVSTEHQGSKQVEK